MNRRLAIEFFVYSSIALLPNTDAIVHVMRIKNYSSFHEKYPFWEEMHLNAHFN